MLYEVTLLAPAGNGKRSDPSEAELDAFTLRNARRRQFLESLRGLTTLPEGYGYEQEAKEVTPERLQALEEDTLGSEENREMLRQEEEEEEEEDKSLRDAQLTESLWRKVVSA